MLSAQNDNSQSHFTGLSLGYSYSFNGKGEPQYHLLDVQLNKALEGGRHGGGFIYGFGTEVVLNANRSTIGPKIGGFIFYNGLAIGSEFVTYTDFENWTFRYVFSIGLGSPKARLTINPQVILTNKNYRPIHKGFVNFTWNFILDRKNETKTK